VRLAELGISPPEAGPADWNADGVVVLRSFFRPFELEDYRREWLRENADHPGGWPDTCPYMRNDALRALCCDYRLGSVLTSLTGDQMGVNLNLTGWVSTERDWHADAYLNEPEVGDFYAAVWTALDDIDPDSGPFQYVPGSHRWPQITRQTIGRFYDLNDVHWPKKSEGILTELFATEIEERKAEVITYVPRQGDVLIWHGRLLHRGSKPKVPGTPRPALIAHYSGIHHRPRMPAAVQHEAGGWYFPIYTTMPVRA